MSKRKFLFRLLTTVIRKQQIQKKTLSDYSDEELDAMGPAIEHALWEEALLNAINNKGNHGKSN
jgi:hypothetical protein